MREYWANVYADMGLVGGRFPTRRGAERGILNQPAFRIHVRLKPEGAPRRYASEANRRAWETDAKACRKTMRTFRVSAESIRPDD